MTFYHLRNRPNHENISFTYAPCELGQNQMNVVRWTRHPKIILRSFYQGNIVKENSHKQTETSHHIQEMNFSAVLKTNGKVKIYTDIAMHPIDKLLCLILCDRQDNIIRHDNNKTSVSISWWIKYFIIITLSQMTICFISWCCVLLFIV